MAFKGLINNMSSQGGFPKLLFSLALVDLIWLTTEVCERQSRTDAPCLQLRLLMLVDMSPLVLRCSSWRRTYGSTGLPY